MNCRKKSKDHKTEALINNVHSLKIRNYMRQKYE